MAEPRKALADLDEAGRKKLFAGVEEELAKIPPPEFTDLPDEELEDLTVSPEILAIITRGHDRHNSAQRYILRGSTVDGNPLRPILTGETSSVMVECEIGGKSIHGNLRLLRKVELSAEDYDFANNESEFKLSASSSLEADADLEGDDLLSVFNTDQVDDENGNEQDFLHLCLDVENWPENSKLLDVNVFETGADHPIAVLTVRRIEGGYELTVDADDHQDLKKQSMYVALRVVGGDDHG